MVKCSHLHSLKEFNNDMESHATTTGMLLVCGNFNFHFEVYPNRDTYKLRETYYFLSICANMFQMATHTHSSHVLDLVIACVSEEVEGLVQCVDTDGSVLSDHAPILFSIPYRKPGPKQKQVTLKKTKDIDMTVFLKISNRIQLHQMTSQS